MSANRDGSAIILPFESPCDPTDHPESSEQIEPEESVEHCDRTHEVFSAKSGASAGFACKPNEFQPRAGEAKPPAERP